MPCYFVNLSWNAKDYFVDQLHDSFLFLFKVVHSSTVYVDIKAFRFCLLIKQPARYCVNKVFESTKSCIWAISKWM